MRSPYKTSSSDIEKNDSYQFGTVKKIGVSLRAVISSSLYFYFALTISRSLEFFLTIRDEPEFPLLTKLMLGNHNALFGLSALSLVLLVIWTNLSLEYSRLIYRASIVNFILALSTIVIWYLPFASR